MNRCPITYELCDGKYSSLGIKQISSQLTRLNDLGFSAEEQRHEAALRATKMSIQGVQPKLSAILNIKRGTFNLVDINGKFILKPQHHIFPELPENEDLTMKMAKVSGIEVPLHGMIYSKDGSLTYFIKRFDRTGRYSKLAIEDFAQLAGFTRDTKYNYTVEKLIGIIDKFCTFPMVEKVKFFKRFLFNYLTGNEDMHLKNYSLLRRDGKIELSPAYDFLNTSIVLKGDIEETALKIKGKNRNLTKNILIEYLGKERLSLNSRIINNILSDLGNAYKEWISLLEKSFLSDDLKEAYLGLLSKRASRLGIS